jgi:outer membrane protein OmpA-like peptidoglycan-associated protein
MNRVTCLLALLASGCASGAPSDLRAARDAYTLTTTSAVIDPLPLVDARTALDRAEKSYKRRGDNEVTRTFAYVAERKAEIAQSAGRIIAEERATKQADKDIAVIDDDPLRTGQRLPATTSEALVYTAGALARDRAVVRSEQREEGEIVDNLHHVGHMRDEPGGFDVMLPAPRLFDGDATVLRGPVSELDTIAFAILRAAPHHNVTVESRADTPNGPDAYDRHIAQLRADAVAAYLAERGVDKTRIHAVGLPPQHWDPEAASLHGLERRIEVRVSAPTTSPSPETP